MDMTRVEFLRSLVVGAGTAVSACTAFGAPDALSSDNSEAGGRSLSASERNRQLVEELTREAFAKNLNTRFRILDKESPTVVEATLAQVREKQSSGEYEQFSLLFNGPSEPLLSQKTYELEHGTMGSFELFLVPISVDEKGACYEAVFNRLRK